jgi:PAS domain S-box-containing protein
MQKILAIDDKMDNLVTLSGLLKNLMPGCALITAQSGMEGIEKAKAGQPDVILLDVMMPEMDGFETCRRLKTDDSTKHIPVIMITAIRTDPRSRIKCLEIGADAFLAKPIDEYELVSQVKVALRIKRAEDALREERDSLERLIEERTAELSRVNKSLQAEITERKQAEEQLRFVTDHAPVLIAHCDRERRYKFVNQPYAQMFGLLAADLVGKHPRDLLGEEAYALAAPHMETALAGQAAEYDLMLPATPDGPRFVHVGYAPERDASGRVVGFIAALADITERKQAEDELANKSIILRSIIDNSGSLIYLLDTDGRFTLANRELCELFGTTTDQIVGKTREDMIPAEVAKQHRDNDLEVIRLGSAVSFEERNPQADGVHTYLTVKFPLKHADGKVYAVGGVSKDITERKQMEEALRQSEGLYRAIGESIDYGVWVCTPDGRNTYASESWLRMVGITQEQCSDYGWGNVLHPEDAERSVAAWKECVRTEGVWNIEHRFRGVDGQWHPVLARGIAVRNEQGQITCWAGIHLDVSERYQAEAERQKFVMLADSSSEFIGMCDLDLTPIYVNPAGMRMVGLPDMEAACRVKVPDYFFPEDQQFIRDEFFPRVLREGHGEMEIRLRHFQTGEPIWVSYYLFHVRNASGALVGWATVSRDITERKRADETLAASEKDFRSLAESMPQIVWVCQPDGNNIYFNQQWVDYTGLSLEESYGAGWNKPFHPDDQQRAWDAWQDAVTNNAVYSLECRLRRYDGEYFWWLIRGVPILNEIGEILKWFGTYTDIHNIKQAEQTIRTNEAFLNEVGQIAKIGGWEMDLVTGKATWTRGTYDIVELDYGKSPPGPDEHWDYFPREFHAQIAEAMRALIEENKLFDYTVQLCTAKGNIKWCRSIGRAAHEGGKCLKIYGTLQDVTERKQAALELQKLNEELEQRVAERTAELAAKAAELERVNKVFVGRELRMRELKEQIAELEKRLQHD